MQEITLHDCWRFAQRYWRTLLGGTLLGGAGAVALAVAMPVRFDASVTIDIARTGGTPAAAYTYDAYYRLEADDAFAQSVEQWLKTPRVVQDILARADVSAPARLRTYGRVFTVRRVSAVSVVVRYRQSSAERARAIADAMRAVLAERTAALRSEAAGWFRPIVHTPVITPTPRRYGIAGALGALGGAVLGAVGAAFLKRRV